MADNVAITAGSGTTIAADDVGSGVLHQRVKVTWGVDGTGTDVNASTPLPVVSTAAVAHDGDGSGVNPLLFGLYAHLTQPTAVSASSDAVRAFGDADGAQVIRHHANLPSLVSGTISNTDGARTAVIAASGDAAVKHYLTDVMLFNSSASAVAVDIEDGTTDKAVFLVPAGGGVVKSFSVPIAGTANTAWNIDAASATTTIYATFLGFKSKV